ncbi:phosphocarrier protein [Scopulibacillus darangshiensis]|uniref:Phosphocarrier protein HPr n=1 Tax=Scopulibacillus darangshiensis TaxID=442528 RepID=A0A4R2PA32_9BACL|nr:phosphocarrier protein HPr [Scopulibacillus darangshiensis]TCP31797.1 phosphocarrier protein [Scopulibacillus darangshiensis]
MVEKTYTIIDETGIHARPATTLVSEAGKFSADAQLEYNGQKANMKSIMGVMAMGIGKGARIKIITEGHDADRALEAIDKVIKEQGLAE